MTFHFIRWSTRVANLHKKELTWAKHLQCRRYKVSVVVVPTEGGLVYLPPIYRNDEVNTPGVYQQRSERDVFEVQSTIDQFQPPCTSIDVRAVFYAVKRLGLQL